MDLYLSNKKILVTGADIHVLSAMARCLVSENARPIILLCVEEDEIQEDSFKDFEHSAELLVCKLHDTDELKGKISQLVSSGNLDGLISIFLTPMQKSSAQFDDQEFRRIAGEILVHQFMLVQQVVPHLTDSVSSIVTVMINKLDGEFDPTHLQPTLEEATRSLTREWAVDLLGRGLRANAVVVNNSILDDERLGELCNTAVFLLSNRSSHTTGQVIELKGVAPSH